MEKAPKVRLVAVVEDGRITSVYCDSREIDFSVIDKDTQDSDEWKEAADLEYETAHDNEFFKIY